MPLVPLKNITEAVEQLRAGALLIYPTETAYALGADATNQKSARKIFQVKSRSKNKPLPIIVASLAMAERYGNFSFMSKELAEKYWPGPLTIILTAKKKLLPRSVIGQDGTIAIRVSSHPPARLLARRLGRPIISTSANLSGQGNTYSARTVRKFFSRSPKTIYFLSGGNLPRRRSSTIVALKNGKLMVLRQGSIKTKGIRN